ncbi:coronin [Parastagonospora nodorum]|uniref:Coronin n=1 Tax=Phaeosphaeria nodorum (strain SN15 / ATCC MYA-4574 / FGSC 10173) TaxID=321614 RepID=A0A7U2I731_PHANO|nr:coronin [Parastagonospora nodorum]QRD04219.1 coronin [Parastagonospora nodorum SN15]KAH3926113.1 coronin [Parastagonospora nodorum]KAH3960579.1 coronin [Parastagonospora nodorum]KAH3995306.1 coronin [Parastagonospora nodorum]
MAGRFVRASKYRHVFGQGAKKEQCYDNLRISKNAWDTNLIKANPEYIAVNWEASGGGAFAVIPINEKGRAPDQIPLFRGHTAAVLDTDWSPFNDSLIASASDDGKVFIWKVPENFTLHTDAEEPADVSPQVKLSGHMRKVGHVLFNPAAENVLASSSGDCTVKLWDVEAGKARLTLTHKDIVQSLSWSADGAYLVTTSRDKKLRVWDVRQEKPAQEVPGHPGAKNSRAVWMGEHDRIATTGFSRMSDRQLGLWDPRNPSEPIGGFEILDSISGVCMPFWDDGTQCLYLAGKGDGNIRYYEYENDKFEYLTQYTSPNPQRGVAFMPKRGINLHDNEVLRAFKTVNDTYIEPVSFIVPRRSEMFQSDIYPPTTGLRPGTTADEWFGGKTAVPPKISLESVYDGEAPKEVPAESIPKPSQPAAAASKPTPAATIEKPAQSSAPAPVASRGPPPTMNDNKQSLAAGASKFADDDVSDKASESSFEEVTKPVSRHTATASRQEEKTRGPAITRDPEPTPAKPTPAPTMAPSEPGATLKSSEHTPSASTSAPAASSGGPASALRDALSDIKSQLEHQNRVMSDQSDQIALLVREVSHLKGKLGSHEPSDREKDERIRQLELELEEARS